MFFLIQTSEQSQNETFGGKQLQQVVQVILNFCINYCARLWTVQKITVTCRMHWKYGSNTYVIGILLILSYKCFASVVTGSAAPCRWHGQQSRIPAELKCKHLSVYTISYPQWNAGTIYTYFGWQGVCTFLNCSAMFSHTDLSITSFIFITSCESGQGIWKLGPTLSNIWKRIILSTTSRIQTWKTMQHP